jgi:DNA-binding GntR family transcriptional regulator
LTVGTHGSKYELIARALADAIGEGTYKVGTVLPSEPTLASSFGVSRHTVRAALRHLQHIGLISSQQGVGSIVRADRGKSRYTQSFDSVADLQQYALNTDFDVIGKEELVVDSELAPWLGCKPGERWWHVSTTRYTKSDGVRVGFSEIYIPYAFRSMLHDMERTKTSLIFLIERQLGQSITEIRQDISAVAASAAEAAVLGITAGQPALQIERHYLGAGNQVLEVSRTIFLPQSFAYSMRVRLTGALS